MTEIEKLRAMIAGAQADADLAVGNPVEAGQLAGAVARSRSRAGTAHGPVSHRRGRPRRDDLVTAALDVIHGRAW